jgi:drug/metabolite transporter (DMT)-like permease
VTISTPNYRKGGFYAVATALLLATQEPFSALAAKQLTSPYFVGLTQVSLLLSVPLLTLPSGSRRDFVALLSNTRNLRKLAVLFVIGLCGLLLYNFGLATAHPIIVAAILNLSPFWAVLVTLAVARKGVPVSILAYVGCFAAAFIGAMTVAFSQMETATGEIWRDVVNDFWGRRWMFALPVPLFFSLSGALIGRWFADFDEAATIAANFVVSGLMLIPATAVMALYHPVSLGGQWTIIAILLLMLGTLSAAAAGRVFYQLALSSTGNDNGFVTMFFLLVPALSALISVPLSWWIPVLHIVIAPMFFSGLALILVALSIFSIAVWRRT